MTIQDKRGANYSLIIDIDDTMWRLDVRDRRVLVGRLFAMPTGETLRLQDIALYSEVLFPESLSKGFLRRLFRIPHRPKDYRFRGLGAKLLGKLIELAREHGFTLIEGEIKPNDLHRNSRLPDWYRAQGFTVEATQCAAAPYLISIATGA